ncbi:MAG: ribonuclease P protein component [Clostridia bacterium]|nr:ribonuclease P protein component [Clostridia bacterium]
MIKTVPIKKNYEFLRIYKKGKFYVGKFIILYVLANNFSMNRLGITASKKVGKSVIRNRLRRLIKENYRMYESTIKEGYDYVFVARNTDVIPVFSDIKREMKFLLKKLDVFIQEKKD